MRRIIKKIKNDLIYIFVKILLFVLVHIPAPLTKYILYAIALFASFLPTRENRTAYKNLSVFYDKKKSKRILRDMYLHWAISVSELIAVIFRNKDVNEFASIGKDSKGILDEALSEKKGIVFLTAHLGNWELMAVSLAKAGYNIYTVAKESYDPRFTGIIREKREKNGVKCIFRKEEGITGKIRNVISSNAVMGFLIDQNTNVPSVMVKFMGFDAPTPVFPARILKETGAALVVGYNHRINGKIHTEVKRVCYSCDEGEAEILERVNNMLSEEIIRFPHEWIWIHDRWKFSC